MLRYYIWAGRANELIYQTVFDKNCSYRNERKNRGRYAIVRRRKPSHYKQRRCPAYELSKNFASCAYAQPASHILWRNFGHLEILLVFVAFSKLSSILNWNLNLFLSQDVNLGRLYGSVLLLTVPGSVENAARNPADLRSSKWSGLKSNDGLPFGYAKIGFLICFRRVSSLWHCWISLLAVSRGMVVNIQWWCEWPPKLISSL